MASTSSLLRGLQLEDGLATRSAQDTAKRFGCCHHGRNLASETVTARPTVLDNFIGVSFAARAARRNGFNPRRGGRTCSACAADLSIGRGGRNWKFPLAAFDRREVSSSKSAVRAGVPSVCDQPSRSAPYSG